MNINALYTLAEEFTNDLYSGEEFSQPEIESMCYAVGVFITLINKEEFDLSDVLEARKLILVGIPPQSIRSRAIMSFYHDIELYSEEENKFREAMV